MFWLSRFCWWLTCALLVVRQIAAVLPAIAADLSIQRRFLPLQVGGFVRRQRAGLHAFADAILLILFALVNLLRLD